MSNIFIGLKKTCLGVLEREKRGDDNGTSLKEGGVIEMSTTVLPLRDARSFALKYLPVTTVDGEDGVEDVVVVLVSPSLLSFTTALAAAAK